MSCCGVGEFKGLDSGNRIVADNFFWQSFYLYCRQVWLQTHCFSHYLCLKALLFFLRTVLKPWRALVVLASLTENKDRAPTCSCDQRGVGSSQDEVSFTGELQHKLPAPPQTSDFRRDHWPLAGSQPTPLEVGAVVVFSLCTCSGEVCYLHSAAWYFRSV